MPTAIYLPYRLLITMSLLIALQHRLRFLTFSYQNFGMLNSKCNSNGHKLTHKFYYTTFLIWFGRRSYFWVSLFACYWNDRSIFTWLHSYTFIHTILNVVQFHWIFYFTIFHLWNKLYFLLSSWKRNGLEIKICSSYSKNAQ